MRMSCNGCRVLRKGCADNCSIRPCLDWITSPRSQSNATFFLAKFYGRAGLVNLLNAGPDHLRPVIFKSLLYEACGRVVNPVHGAVGLMGSGRWLECQSAVEAVLEGKPIKSISSDAALTGCDIRHVSKVSKEVSSAGTHRLRVVNKSKGRFKKLAPKTKRIPEGCVSLGFGTDSLAIDGSVSRGPSSGVESGEGDSVSVDTVEASLGKTTERAGIGELDLELTLALGPYV